MPKMKTNKAVKKRFRITKKGKVLAKRSLRRHMMVDRSPKKKRQSRRSLKIGDSNRKHIAMLLPYNR
ncbi:MAG: 50S ribosomal protein L35 [Candidatus Omnitrophica bacterium]|nr:50S ribosomal protein L35 [Candidatus Omnitrophota bacterium]